VGGRGDLRSGAQPVAWRGFAEEIELAGSAGVIAVVTADLFVVIVLEVKGELMSAAAM
jgi:hypothetical protein